MKSHRAPCRQRSRTCPDGADRIDDSAASAGHRPQVVFAEDLFAKTFFAAVARLAVAFLADAFSAAAFFAADLLAVAFFVGVDFCAGTLAPSKAVECQDVLSRE